MEHPPSPSTTSKAEASVWRLGAGGTILTSVPESVVNDLVAQESDEIIYFYADLEGSSQLTVDAETLDKVYDALATIGITEAQAINAVNAMQARGIIFRERKY